MNKDTFLGKIDHFLTPILLYYNEARFVASIVGVTVNLFHLFVLSQKSMRQLTINIFMIGIAICDFSQMLTFIVILTPEFYRVYITEEILDSCTLPQSYLEYKIMDSALFISKVSPKLAVWLGVSLATLRAVAIRHLTNSRIQDMIQSKYGIRILFIIFLPNVCYFIYEYAFVLKTHAEIWNLPPQCGGNSKNITYIFYYTASVVSIYRISLLVDGIIFKLIPSILLPFFTIILLFEMKKAKKVAVALNVQSSKNNYKSTKLVTFVTITFLISTAPLGILYIVESSLQSFVFLNLTSKLKAIFVLISVLNGTLHVLICFFMSSQYRNTVKNVIGWKPDDQNISVSRTSEFQRTSRF